MDCSRWPGVFLLEPIAAKILEMVTTHGVMDSSIPQVSSVNFRIHLHLDDTPAMISSIQMLGALSWDKMHESSLFTSKPFLE
jgi:hypothetical protein